MAVELRCPDCRAKLKLKKAPEPGTEVECPECYAVFDAPEAEDVRTDDDTPPPRRRPADDADDDDRPRKKKKPKKEKPAAGAPTPRKRKAKKKETNKPLLIGLIAGGLAFLALNVFMLAWFFLKKPAAYELMNYLPPDCTSVSGSNIGHVRKYIEFYKKFESQVNESSFKRAADVVSAAVGGDKNEFLDYMVMGTNGKGEEAMVLKTRTPFDQSLLSKMPGARKAAADGRDYYTVDAIPGVFNGPLKVFSPTPKLVVLCPAGVSGGTFNKMIAGNAGDLENATAARFGPLGKRIVRGTAWYMLTYDNNSRPKEPDNKDPGAAGGDFEKQFAQATKSPKAGGFKISVGSRNVRFEGCLEFADSDAAKALRDRFRDSPLAKTDDASLDPPRYWKQFVSKMIGNQKVGVELYTNLGATTSGDLFIISSECDTLSLMESSSTLVGKMTGSGAGGGGGGGGGRGPGPPPGMNGPAGQGAGGRPGAAEAGVAIP
ncbi:zinc ribbon domain-containing protein [Urbifossiella limnaea]|uniref:Uncharacterized protein n=1 Tax=Urbifossiella limnaea TaxID=2528023 RepID=A0A517XXQ0_9BACT|nr:hypothetical protein [Urbifossiella limnaea]QDU22298.1 hypothetical protein ETAA1_42760 [Urbifossiella limnaea]